MSVSRPTCRRKYSEEKARGWYANWRERIRKWVECHSDSEMAKFVMFVPDMLMLSVGLIRDPRVPSPLKVSLISAVIYVLSPFDLVPEALLGVAGLVDDAGVLVFTLHRLLSISSIEQDEWEDIFHDHWRGDGHPVQIIWKLFQRFTKNAANLLGRAWRAFRRIWTHNSRENKSYKVKAITITS